MRPPMDCTCMDEQCRSEAFESREITTDRLRELLSRIELQSCRRCGRYWLRYTLVDEANGAWGKWYRGLIAQEAASDLTPERARELLASMKWHFYGGSYYRTAGEYSSGPVVVGPPSCMAWAA